MDTNFNKDINKVNKLSFNGAKKPEKPNAPKQEYKQMKEIPSDNGASRAYFMGGISFKGSVGEENQSADEIREDCKRILKERFGEKAYISKYFLSNCNDSEILKIKRDVIKELIKNEKYNCDDIYKVVHNDLYISDDNYSVAKKQANILLNFEKNKKKYTDENIFNILSKLKSACENGFGDKAENLIIKMSESNIDSENIKEVLSSINFFNKEEADVQFQLAEKLMEMNLLKEDTGMLGKILSKTETKEQIAFAIKLLENPRLLKNKNIASSDLDYVFSAINSKERADAKCRCIDIIASNDSLSTLGEYISSIISEVNSEAGVQIIEKILNNKTLCTNDDFMDNLMPIFVKREEIPNIIANTADSEKIIEEAIDKCLEKSKITDDIVMLSNFFVCKIAEKINLTELTIKEKSLILSVINDLQSEIELASSDKQIFSKSEVNEINNFKVELQKSLSKIITPTKITSDDIKAMNQGFFANNNKELDELLSTTDFTQFKKAGLPLKYSRSEFLSDLNNILDKVSDNEKDEIFKKLEIEPIKNDEGKITGYDGIINLEELSSDGIEGEVLKKAIDFIKNNSITSDNPKLNNALNSLIKGMPEFINIIGKEQHGTHTLSLDSHILTVLQNAMTDPDYQSLSDLDKTCLKYAIIMHDIAKSEGEVDKAHEEKSALYARDIMKKYKFSESTKDRIFELIKYHNWFEKYNTTEDKTNNGKYNISDEIATYFRRDNDFKMAKIFAKADLMGVSDAFYRQHADAFENSKAPIQESLDKINQTGQLVFTNKIVKKWLLPKVEIKGDKTGETYNLEVLDFTKIKPGEDLEKFGFEPGTTRESLRLFVHMAQSVDNLESVYHLSDISNAVPLCTSYISLNKQGGYVSFDEDLNTTPIKFGVSLECENQNIANGQDLSQGSGKRKFFDWFSAEITGSTEERQELPEKIKGNLNLNNEEYSELYKQLENKKYITQIKDNDKYFAGKKEFSGKEIKDTFGKVLDGFLTDSYNEFNLYDAKINALVAKVNSVDEIPEEYLKFADEHNFPIYILGGNNQQENLLS